MTHDKDCKYSHYPGTRRERQLMNTAAAERVQWLRESSNLEREKRDREREIEIERKMKKAERGKR